MPKTLLLADDSVTIQKVVGISFANEDVQIVTVDNGDDAVTRARAIRPDIVLADVVMPGKSGYDVCAALKADPALAHIPVLLLTGTFETFDEDRANRVGADGHITKPFEAQALVELVTARLASAAAPRAAAAPAAAAAEEPEPFDFLEPEAETRESVHASGTARPARGDTDDAFAFPAESLDVALEPEDDEVDLGNEATAARTTLLLDDEPDFAHATTAPPSRGATAPPRPGGTASPRTGDTASPRTGGTATPRTGGTGAPRTGATAQPVAAPPAPPLPQDDAGDLTTLMLTEDGPTDPVAGDPLAEFESVAADPFAGADGREWDVAPDGLDDPFVDRAADEPAAAAPAGAPPPSFSGPLFDDDPSPEFELADLATPTSPAAPAPASAPSAAAAPAAELSGAMREQMHGALEKIAWEALGDVSERIVREAVERIEKVAWDVIPRMAETLIREEIRKLKGEG
jgi:CheY-like chemotaxis protein